MRPGENRKNLAELVSRQLLGHRELAGHPRHGRVSGSHFEEYEEYEDEGRSEEREPSSRSEPTGLYRRLGLIQPESHVHFAVHRDRGRKVFAGLLMLACASVELAEAEVAVGDNRTHA